MISSTPQTRRRLALLFIAAAVLWFVVDFYAILVDFFGEHRGIRFYREHPYLLGVCVFVAVSAALCAHFVEGWLNVRSLDGQRDEPPTEDAGPRDGK
jgi:hypothetical protein